MRKGIFVAVLTTTVGLLLLHADSDARRRRVRARNRAAQHEPPVSAEISKALKGLSWGDGHQKVVDHYTDPIRAEFRPQIAKAASDQNVADRLLAQQNAAIERITKSYIVFSGPRTRELNGWRVSFIADEFHENAGESMVVVREASDQRFFFFKNDQLYKMFVAFNAEVFPGLDFEGFAQRIQERYGPALRVMRTNPRTQAEELAELRWQDETTLLAAIDQTSFYGIFSLRFTNKQGPQQLTAAAAQGRPNALLDTAIREGSGDANSDVIDRITGRRRAAPGGTAAQQAQGQGRTARPQHAPPQGTAAPVLREDDDPLGGI